jgi:hypothetical protein
MCCLHKSFEETFRVRLATPPPSLKYRHYVMLLSFLLQFQFLFCFIKPQLFDEMDRIPFISGERQGIEPTGLLVSYWLAAFSCGYLFSRCQLEHLQTQKELSPVRSPL